MPIAVHDTALHSVASHIQTLLGAIFFVSLLAATVTAAPADFNQLFQSYCDQNHMRMLDGGTVQLILDKSGGCRFVSKTQYLYGQVSMRIKLIGGDSAGTVTAFYMASNGQTQDELDFEFLGNVTGQPYLVQTNLYTHGVGDREQRHTLWFDPTADFHTYTILWNPNIVRFLVDGIPIRVFTNREASGLPYPQGQPMWLYGALWNGDEWATQNGRVKTDWSHAPFVASLQAFDIDACNDATGNCQKGGAPDLTQKEKDQLNWVQQNHLAYDYCHDSNKNPHYPAECSG